MGSSWKRRRGAWLAGALVACLGVGAAIAGAGCQGNGKSRGADAPAEGQSRSAAQTSDFDADRSFGELEKLAGFDRRHTGERGSEKARKHLKKRLSKASFAVAEVETPLGAGPDAPVATHLFARPKGSDAPPRDAILLAAPYDAPVRAGVDVRGANAGASGSAVLVELARLLQDARADDGGPALDVWLAFVDGDGQGPRAAATTTQGAGARWPGSDAFAAWLAAQPEAERIRLVVFVDRVGDAHLAVARDLASSRVHREVFFDVASRRGHPAFDAARPSVEVAAGHRAFAERGGWPVVALVGASSRPFAIEDRDLHDEVGETSTASLLAVGDTTWVSVFEIADRLARIDAFRADPLGGGPGDLALPGADGAGPGDDAGEPLPATDGAGPADAVPSGRDRR